MLQLYGNSRSRAMRCLWMLEGMGKPYQLIEKSTRADDLQSAEYLRLNPNARIPTLVDGDLVLWESMAINLSVASESARFSLSVVARISPLLADSRSGSPYVAIKPRFHRYNLRGDGASEPEAISDWAIFTIGSVPSSCHRHPIDPPQHAKRCPF